MAPCRYVLPLEGQRVADSMRDDASWACFLGMDGSPSESPALSGLTPSEPSRHSAEKVTLFEVLIDHISGTSVITVASCSGWRTTDDGFAPCANAQCLAYLCERRPDPFAHLFFYHRRRPLCPIFANHVVASFFEFPNIITPIKDWSVHFCRSITIH